MPDTLTTAQAMRYNRQIVLPEIDIEGQEKLLNANVLLIGVGGLGCAAAQSLVGCGIGHLTLVDDDTVSHTNLPRQHLFSEHHVGQSKVDAACEVLSQRNSDCQLNAIHQRLDDYALEQQIAQSDIVLDCSDNMVTREQINRLCYKRRVPLVSGAAIRFEGQLMVVDPQAGSPCYQCISRFIPNQDLSCNETGILSPVVTTIGVQQALLAVAKLAGFGTFPTGKLLMFDALTMQWQNFAINQSSHCPVCAEQ